MPESAIALVVPEAEELVRAWSEPPVTAPAHITLLYPFLEPARIDDGVVAELAHYFSRVDGFDFALMRVGRFPEAVYLLPEPSEVFRGLTRALADRWPGHPPYGGRFPDTVPHLTVSTSPDAVRRDEVADAVARLLPIRATAREASLWVSDADGWTLRADLPLGPP